MSDKLPLVSVIVPVYNSYDYLQDCFDSIINQTYKNIEIILVNDGSKDGSGHLCDEYKNQYTNVKVVHKNNGGLSSARNAGIMVANGLYYTFIDSDDKINNDMIATMVDLAIEQNADIVKIGIKRVYDNNCIPTYGTYKKTNSIDALNRIYISSEKIISICGKLFNKNLFKDFCFPDGLYFEDEYSTPKLFYKAKNIVMSYSELYYYMQRNNDSIIRGSLTEKKVRDSVYVRKERMDFFRSKRLWVLFYKSKVDYYHVLRKYRLLLKNKSEFLNLYNEIKVECINFFKKNIFIVLRIETKIKLHKLKGELLKL